MRAFWLQIQTYRYSDEEEKVWLNFFFGQRNGLFSIYFDQNMQRGVYIFYLINTTKASN